MKIVIIGSGKIVKNIINHLDKEIEIFGIYSRNLKTSSELAKKVNAKVFTSLDEIKLFKNEFDYVYVATPHTSHFEYAKFCLENDINVLVEKPIVTSVKEIEELIKLSETSNAFISEAMWSFICDPLNELKEFLNKKVVKEAELSFSIFRPRFNKKDRLFIPSLKGGALFDIGIYIVTMAYMFFGEPLNFLVESKIKNNIDVIDKITFDYDKFKVNLYTSFYSFKDIVKIKGDDFIVSSLIRAHAPNKIKVKEGNKTFYIKGETSYNEEFKRIYNYIKEGKKYCPRITLNDNLKIMKLMEKLDKSK